MMVDPFSRWVRRASVRASVNANVKDERIGLSNQVCVVQRALLAGLLMSASCLAQTFPGVSLAEDTTQWPVRKSGLWQLTLQTPGVAPQIVRHCIDARTDRLMQQLTEGTDAVTCAQRTYRREGERFIGESECRFGTSTAVIRSSVTGDFSRSYKGEVDSRIEPPTAGMNQYKVSLNARWLSACPAGWKAGDMDVPGMGRVNIADVQSARRLSAAPTTKSGAK
jgi:hypothetical protein